MAFLTGNVGGEVLRASSYFRVNLRLTKLGIGVPL